MQFRLCLFPSGCFNSTMVRLKYIYDQPKPGGIVFQFHYGSIKIHRRRRQDLQQRRFNSTMVRLKSCRTVFMSWICGFQFHYGSIKIRLVKIFWRLTLRFQFHYGSIKMDNPNAVTLRVRLFQFHYGSIKMMNNIFVSSVEYGFNSTMVRLKFYLVSCRQCRNEVSIPLWFD